MGTVPGRQVLAFSVVAAVFLLSVMEMGNVEGRRHISKTQKNKKSRPEDNHVTPPPVYSPPPGGVVPSDPVSPTPSNDSGPCIFDITDYSVVGDCSSDNTAAFVAAWKAACHVESAIIWAPPGHTFMITSTIFSGPCKPRNYTKRCRIQRRYTKWNEEILRN